MNTEEKGAVRSLVTKLEVDPGEGEGGGVNVKLCP